MAASDLEQVVLGEFSTLDTDWVDQLKSKYARFNRKYVEMYRWFCFVPAGDVTPLTWGSALSTWTGRSKYDQDVFERSIINGKLYVNLGLQTGDVPNPGIAAAVSPTTGLSASMRDQWLTMARAFFASWGFKEEDVVLWIDDEASDARECVFADQIALYSGFTTVNWDRKRPNDPFIQAWYGPENSRVTQAPNAWGHISQFSSYNRPVFGTTPSQQQAGYLANLTQIVLSLSGRGYGAIHLSTDATQVIDPLVWAVTNASFWITLLSPIKAVLVFNPNELATSDPYNPTSPGRSKWSLNPNVRNTVNQNDLLGGLLYYLAQQQSISAWGGSVSGSASYPLPDGRGNFSPSTIASVQATSRITYGPRTFQF